LAHKEEVSKDNENLFEREERAKSKQQDSISSSNGQQQPQPHYENINGSGNIDYTPSTDHAARAQSATEGAELQRDAQTHFVANVCNLTLLKGGRRAKYSNLTIMYSNTFYVRVLHE